MVMRRTINDWYLEAGGRADDSSFDWENDDRPDRGVDAWLDRISAVNRDDRRALPAAGRNSGSSKPDIGSTSGRKRSVRSVQPNGRIDERRISGVPWSVFVRTVHSLHRQDPRLGPRAIGRRLRTLGWTGVTRPDVVEAMGWPHPTSYVNPPPRRRGSARGDAAAVRASGPVTKPRVPQMRVVRIEPLRPDHRRSLDVVTPKLSADFCSSCGVRVSELGICRCS
jgi:hypothetical protein